MGVLVQGTNLHKKSADTPLLNKHKLFESKNGGSIEMKHPACLILKAMSLMLSLNIQQQTFQDLNLSTSAMITVIQQISMCDWIISYSILNYTWSCCNNVIIYVPLDSWGLGEPII